MAATVQQYHALACLGGVSQDESGMRQGDLLQVDVIRARILDAMTGATR